MPSVVTRVVLLDVTVCNDTKEVEKSLIDDNGESYHSDVLLKNPAACGYDLSFCANADAAENKEGVGY